MNVKSGVFLRKLPAVSYQDEYSNSSPINAIRRLKFDFRLLRT
jgi:hypothetical protein